MNNILHLISYYVSNINILLHNINISYYNSILAGNNIVKLWKVWNCSDDIRVGNLIINISMNICYILTISIYYNYILLQHQYHRLLCTLFFSPSCKLQTSTEAQPIQSNINCCNKRIVNLDLYCPW